MARDFAKAVSPGKSYDLEPLIQSLRNDLREELQLTPVDGNTVFVVYKSLK